MSHDLREDLRAVLRELSTAELPPDRARQVGPALRAAADALDRNDAVALFEAVEDLKIIIGLRVTRIGPKEPSDEPRPDHEEERTDLARRLGLAEDGSGGR
ncbi:CATRA system-associated protein [Sphaerisporangium sp. NPDC051011]|uniref:CATRA system-associated protein n=1 Tax=Sphaerisporangium sp. NPDC051011 TaxID=3155792 RepID=UPI0033FC8F55